MAGGTTVTPVSPGLTFYGIVSNVISATQFTVPLLVGRGDTFFNNWMVYVLRKGTGTGAAPQGEQQIATAFVSNSGLVTCPAFTAVLAPGDEILMLHPDISTVLAAGIAAVLAAIGGVAAGVGLCYRGIVTGVPGAGQFTIATLAGQGGNSFIDLSGINPYYAFVKTIAAGTGAPPEGELQPITGYATLTGNFSAGAFTVPVGIGDEILIIHPMLARIFNMYGTPPATGSLVANWQAAEQTLVNIGAANTRNKVNTLMIDMNAIGGTLTIRMYHAIAGVQRQIYSQAFTVALDGPGRWTINGPVGIFDILRVTCQSNLVGDNGVAIAYSYMLEHM
ncbi:MAG: hypothetical protein PHI12_08585 [Dehalococcoidales bacterium]|nr:hypothetical protein [Dehalococcoidales bacterium]